MEQVKCNSIGNIAYRLDRFSTFSVKLWYILVFYYTTDYII